MDKVVVRNISSDDTGSLIVSSTNYQGDYDSYCIASSSIGLKESTVEDMIDRRVKELLPEALIKSLEVLGLYVGPDEEVKLKTMFRE